MANKPGRMYSKRGWSAAERLASKSTVDARSGCILWTGAVAKGGYGNIGYGGRTHAAHRLAWELKNGPIPAGMSVCHRCDVRACINTDHMFLGTAADNSKDRVTKGRQARGETHPQAKLTSDDVRMIRQRPAAHRTMATELGVNRATVLDVLKGRSWRHLD